ncbi:hypothetical protein COX05_04570 [candidate division WWE3 bacterium CG22_combo_CG10-13_8_21_14_all_39_12]|uniref:Uncharacterized protein n=1 Tax=candidate division WWE3 bacterium CG22_combo_CG10-13_8_21_14_all_39_12 TaxID=1975094 RepID=A0A2H0BGM4_UNCKA|nr:MAG: hypothetical protein COX05_04570 [candidate division WWE3 bacterium CG22_combo_CG10-13_8_21_14_all_39_12]
MLSFESIFLNLGLYFGIVISGVIALISFQNIELRRVLNVCIFLGLVLRIFFIWYTPLYYSPDEEAHVAYIDYVQENRSLPIQQNIMGLDNNTYEFYQPPMYYVLSSSISFVGEKVFDADDSLRLIILRHFSLVMWLIGILFVLRALENLGVSKLSSGIVMCFYTLLPTYIFSSVMVNNDNLSILWGSILFYMFTKGIMSYKSLLVGLILGLSFLTKINTVVFVFAVVSNILLLIIRDRREKSKVLSYLSYLCVTLFVFCVVISPFLWRNYVLYGSILAQHVANVRFVWVDMLEGLIRSTRNMVTTFWATSGGFNNLMPFPEIGIAVTSIALLGLLFSRQVINTVQEKSFDLYNRKLLVVYSFSIAIVVNIVLIIRFGLLYNQAQGRFMFILLVPLALLLGLGWQSFFQMKDNQKALLGVTCVFIVFAMWFTWFSVVSFPK